MRVLHDGPLYLSYGQFSILEPMAEHPDLEDAFAGQRNGLCGGAVPGALHFMTGTHTGQIALRVEEYDEAPPLPEPEWGDVVEALFSTTSSELVLMGLMGDEVVNVVLNGGRNTSPCSPRTR